MFYLFYDRNFKTSLNKGKPSLSEQSRRNHNELTRVFQEILETLVFIGISEDWQE